MRLLKDVMERETAVVCKDAPGEGGACHEYQISPQGDNGTRESIIHFQNGPIGEHGANGCQNEDLLLVVIDRLKSFQNGDFPCRENALALNLIESGLHWLNARTLDRRQRGVEGKNKK